MLVICVRLSVNLQARTIEQVIAKMQNSHLELLRVRALPMHVATRSVKMRAHTATASGALAFFAGPLVSSVPMSPMIASSASTVLDLKLSKPGCFRK